MCRLSRVTNATVCLRSSCGASYGTAEHRSEDEREEPTNPGGVPRDSPALLSRTPVAGYPLQLRYLLGGAERNGDDLAREVRIPLVAAAT